MNRLFLAQRNRLVRNCVLLFLPLSLSACGGGGGGSTTAPPPNQAPTADAGADQTIVEGNVVTLSAAASSDPDGSIAAYAWSQTAGPTAALQNASTASPTFDTPLTDVQLLLTFQVTITDNRGATASASTNITVDPSQPPAIDAGQDFSVIEGESASLFATATDDDGFVASFSWVQLAGPTVTLFGADTESATFVAPSIKLATSLEFELTVVDNTNDASTDIVVVSEIPLPNVAPTASAGTDQSLLEGNVVTLSATGSADSDGTVDVYGWAQIAGPAVALQNPDSVSPTFESPLTNVQLSLTFEVTVTDDEGATDSATTVVTIEPSQPPSVNASAEAEVVERQTVSLLATATDVDGSVASYSWTQVSGTSAILSGADTSSAGFSAPEVNAIETLQFEVTVTDNTNDATTDVVSVIVNPNLPPELSVHFPCDSCRFYGDAISVNGTASSGLDNPFVSSTDGIASITVDAGAGARAALVQVDNRWIAQNVPVPDTGSTFSISVTATDDLGESTTQVLQLSYQPTLTSVLIDFDPVTPDVLYVLETNNPIERLFSLDLNTGRFTKLHEPAVTLSNIGQAGTTIVQPDGTRLIINELFGRIVAFDLITGAFSVVSDASNGSGPIINQPMLMALDSDDNRLVIYDADQQSLWSVDILSGDRTVVSDNVGIGAGVSFDDPTALAVDSAANIAYLQDIGAVPSGGFLSIDLATGDRAALPNSGLGIGTSNSMFIDAARSRLIVQGGGSSDRVFQIDPISGNGAVISEATSTADLASVSRRQILGDPLSDRYVINAFSSNINSLDTDQWIAVDPDTGDRTLVFEDSTVDSGQSLFVDGSANGFDVDFTNNFAYLATASSSITRIDLDTDARRILSAGPLGTGTAFQTIRGLAVDLAANRVLAIDVGVGALMAADLTSGDRSVISGGLIGTGPAFATPVAIALDSANDRAFVMDQGLEAVISVDLVSGERSILSGGSTGANQLMGSNGLGFDSANNRLLVTVTGTGSTATTQLLAVDLASGDQTTVSGFGAGSGPLLDGIQDVELLEGTDFAVVSAGSVYYRINLTTGDRIVLAESGVENGESISNHAEIAFNPTTGIIYGWSNSFDALFAIDSLTGDRVVVSK